MNFMIATKRISYLLSNDKIQRFCYLIALIIWMTTWLIYLQINYYEITFDLKNILLIVMTAGLLVFQVAFNKKSAWVCILGLIISYSGWKIFELINFVILNLNRFYERAIANNIKEILIIVFTLMSIAAINWLVIKIKPVK